MYKAIRKAGSSSQHVLPIYGAGEDDALFYISMKYMERADLGDRIAPLDSERAGQLEAKLRLVEVAGREPVVLQDRLAVERPPRAIRASRHVGDDHVRVKVRVLRARGAVLVSGRDEPGAALAHYPSD